MAKLSCSNMYESARVIVADSEMVANPHGGIPTEEVTTSTVGKDLGKASQTKKNEENKLQGILDKMKERETHSDNHKDLSMKKAYDAKHKALVNSKASEFAKAAKKDFEKWLEDFIQGEEERLSPTITDNNQLNVQNSEKVSEDEEEDGMIREMELMSMKIAEFSAKIRNKGTVAGLAKQGGPGGNSEVLVTKPDEVLVVKVNDLQASGNLESNDQKPCQDEEQLNVNTTINSVLESKTECSNSSCTSTYAEQPNAENGEDQYRQDLGSKEKGLDNYVKSSLVARSEKKSNCHTLEARRLRQDSIHNKQQCFNNQRRGKSKSYRENVAGSGNSKAY